MRSRKWFFFVPVLVLLLIAIAFLVTCSVKQTTDPLSAANLKISESTSLHGSNGSPRSEYYFGETIFLSLDNLYPETQTLIRIRKDNSKDCSCKECVSTLLVATDRDGRIDDLEIWYNVGYDLDGNPVRADGNYTVQILQPSTTDPWIMYKIKFKILLSLPTTAYLQLTDAFGIYKGCGVLAGNDVFVQGGNLGANTEVHLYVVKDKNYYSSGDVYQDESGGAEVVKTSASGELLNSKIWPTASVIGAYDLVADVAPFGQFNIGDVIAKTTLAGLVVQAPPSGADILAEVACDANGNHKNEFAETEAIWASVNPLTRPADLPVLMDLCHSTIFISPHKSVWQKNDPLVHIETVGSLNAPIEALVEPTSGSLALTMVRGESKLGYRQPLRLWPGDYDMIVDVNNNFSYDPGVDILDGGPHVGLKIPGTPPAIKFIFFALPDFPIVANGKFLLRAVVLRGDHTPVTDAKVQFNIGRGTGSLDPKSGLTDEQGMTHTFLWGMQEAQWSIIRAVVTVDGVQYEARISVWGELCLAHNQGIIIGG